MCMRRRGKGAGRRRRAGCVRRQREVTFYKRAGHPNVRSSLSRLRDARGGERSFSAQSSERLTGLLLFAWLYLGVEMSVFWLNFRQQHPHRKFDRTGGMRSHVLCDPLFERHLFRTALFLADHEVELLRVRNRSSDFCDALSRLNFAENHRLWHCSKTTNAAAILK